MEVVSARIERCSIGRKAWYAGMVGMFVEVEMHGDWCKLTTAEMVEGELDYWMKRDDLALMRHYSCPICGGRTWPDRGVCWKYH